MPSNKPTILAFPNAARPAQLPARDRSESHDSFATALLESSSDCIKVLETNGCLTYMNPKGQLAMEIDDFDTVEGAEWASFWPEAARFDIANSISEAAAGRSTRLKAYCPTARGTPRWWDVSVSPVLGDGGHVVRVLAVSRDITDTVQHEAKLNRKDRELEALNDSLKKELSTRDTLMREIDHRVKNSLSMIAAILRLQARKAVQPAVQRKLASAATRVHMVARVHERLQSSEDIAQIDLAKYLPAVTDDVTQALSRQGVELSCDVASVTISSERAVALGMIATELVTNAYKHAFPERGGWVKLTLDRDPPGYLRLSIRDNGTGGCVLTDPMSPTSTRSDTDNDGLGTRIVQLYVSQLGGTLSCASPKGMGTTFTLELQE